MARLMQCSDVCGLQWWWRIFKRQCGKKIQVSDVVHILLQRVALYSSWFCRTNPFHIHLPVLLICQGGDFIRVTLSGSAGMRCRWLFNPDALRCEYYLCFCTIHLIGMFFHRSLCLAWRKDADFWRRRCISLLSEEKQIDVRLSVGHSL